MAWREAKQNQVSRRKNANKREEIPVFGISAGTWRNARVRTKSGFLRVIRAFVASKRVSHYTGAIPAFL